VVAPAAFNTINKWAAGISDTLAHGLLTEAIGKGLPVVALPFINTAEAARTSSCRALRRPPTRQVSSCPALIHRLS
jgi:flavoprotein